LVGLAVAAEPGAQGGLDQRIYIDGRHQADRRFELGARRALGAEGEGGGDIRGLCLPLWHRPGAQRGESLGTRDQRDVELAAGDRPGRVVDEALRPVAADDRLHGLARGDPELGGDQRPHVAVAGADRTQAANRFDAAKQRLWDAAVGRCPARRLDCERDRIEWLAGLRGAVALVGDLAGTDDHRRARVDGAQGRRLFA
jgi:hypothetical protein